MSLTNPWADLRKAPRAGLPTGDTVSMRGGRASRWAPRVSVAFAVAAVVAAPLSYWLYVVNRSHAQVHYLFGDYTAGLLYPVVGAYLLRRRPDNRVGWVF